MGTAQSNVMRLARGARNGVEVEMVLLIGYQGRRHVRVIMFQSRAERHKALAASRGRVSGRRLAQIPLPDFAIFRASKEEKRRRLRDNTLDPVRMTPVDPRIGIPLAQIAHAPKEVVETLAARGRSRCRRRGRTAVCGGVFEIKDPHLGIASAGDQGPIVGVGHELDGENIGSVAGKNGRVQGKRRSGGVRLVGVDVQMLIVGARGQQATRLGPAVLRQYGIDCIITIQSNIR